MKNIITLYCNSRWLPALIFLVLLGCFTAAAISQSEFLNSMANGLFYLAALAFIGVLGVAIWRLSKKGWRQGAVNVLSAFACTVATFFAFGFLMFASMFGPSEDGFADNLKIPDGIDIAEPESDLYLATNVSLNDSSDQLQERVRKAQSVPGNNKVEFTPSK